MKQAVMMSTTENLSEHCHNSERITFFKLPKNFIITVGGYTRIKFPEKIVFYTKN